MNQRIATVLILSTSLATAALTGCSSERKNTAVGAGVGAGVGAVAGAVIGHQSGNRVAGALIGAAVGAGVGGLVGNRLDKQKKELEKVAETKRTDQGLITKLKSDILFDSGKADLKAAAVNSLGELAAILKKYPENVLTIKGYTDSKGNPKTNQTLSEQRAIAVKTQIVLGGVPAETVKVQGMGPAEPIGDNNTEAGRLANRRVEIEIRVDESKVPKQG